MAIKIRKIEPPRNIYISLAIKHSPLWAPFLVAILFIAFIIWPAASKVSTLSRKITQYKNDITAATASNASVAKMTEELANFKKTAAEFENRLPKRMKTTLIIETLQEITKKSKLQFALLEPLPIKKYILEETQDVFVELPVKVKLNCGYYDLVDFVKKIEAADQLMKIAD